MSRIQGPYLQQALDIISILNNISDLKEITLAAQTRIRQLQTNPLRLAEMTLVDNRWQIVINEKQITIDLGKRVPSSELLTRAKLKSPTPAHYQLPDEEAQRLMSSREREIVGWWEEGGQRKGYYHVKKYEEAKLKWRRWHDLATDPMAMSYGLEVQGMRKIRELEKRGYKIKVSPP